MKPTRVAGLAAATFALVPVLGSGALPRAQADTSTAAGCIAAKQVWLQVTTDDGRTLASQCVGTPKTGTAALQAAKLPLTRDDKGLLCTIGNYPATCPTTFTGQFWNYYHQVPGKAFEFATKGADQSVPQPGSVEAWCYNAKGTQTCTPPAVKGLSAASPSPSASQSASASQTPLDEVTPPPSTTAPSATSVTTVATPLPTATPSDSQPSVPTSTISASTTTVNATPASAPATATQSPSAPSSAVASVPASDSSGNGNGPWGVIATVAVVVLAALGYLLYRRQRRA